MLRLSLSSETIQSKGFPTLCRFADLDSLLAVGHSAATGTVSVGVGHGSPDPLSAGQVTNGGKSLEASDSAAVAEASSDGAKNV